MKSEKLIIVARIIVKTEKRDFVRAELIKLVAATRTETGCVSYDLHQDNENPDSFLVFEIWKNSDLWKLHMENENLTRYAKATKGAVKEFNVQQMTPIA